MPVQRPSDTSYSEGEKSPFESMEREIHGVNISLKEEHNYETDQDFYELTFFRGGLEQVEFNDAETAREVFDYVCQNVPEDHPQALYIVYGMAKQMQEKLEAQKMQRAVQERQEAIEREREAMDTSYSETAETSNGTISIQWMNEAHTHGAYVISFPKKGSYMIEPFLKREIAEKKPYFTSTVRPELAKKFFDEAVRMMEEGWTVDNIQRALTEMQSEYKGDYLWSQDPNIEHVDLFYRDRREVNGITMSIHYNGTRERYEIIFEDDPQDLPGAREMDIWQPDILFDASTEDAKRVFEYACQQAKVKDNIFDVYKAVEDMAYELGG